jgi:flavin reductase
MQHVSPETFIASMARAATGVSVVTTDGPAGRFGITVSAVSSVSADPPLVLACVNRKSPVAAAIAANGILCINLLADHQQAVADTFAGRPRDGAPYDFASVLWQIATTGAPAFAEAAATFDCVLDQAIEAGTHRIFIGRVVSAGAGVAAPLVYAARGCRRISALEVNA